MHTMLFWRQGRGVKLCNLGALPKTENSMSNRASIQDEYLQALTEDKTLVSVYMINGIRLAGHVTAFDRHVVMLESLAGLQAVFKHAISTVMPDAVERAPRSPAHEAGNRVKTSRA
jgi:host factor-I protein